MAGVAVLVYDGDCGFCTVSASWVDRRSRHLRIVPWQAADLDALGLTAEQCAQAVQLVRGGAVHSGGPAVAQALRECRQPYRALGSVLDAPPMRPVVSRVYVAVARNRHRLRGSSAACASHGDEGHRAGVRREGAGAAVAPAER